jgi:hypothetical protein
MEHDQWDEDHGNNNEEEEEDWPTEDNDNDDKGHHQKTTRDQWDGTEGGKWTMTREHHQATMATVTTTKRDSHPSCIFFLFVCLFFYLF